MRAITFLFLIGIIANSADAAPTQFTEHVPIEDFLLQTPEAEHFVDGFDSQQMSLTQMTPAKAIRIMQSVSKLKTSSKTPLLGKVAKLLATSAASSTSPTHAQKLTTTIAKKSELTAKLTEIMTRLKNEYSSHKAAAEAEVTKITNAKFGIADDQYKPLVAGAKKWCAARVKQVDKKGLIDGKTQAVATAKAVEIAPPKKWKDAAANFEVTYEKGTAYAAVEFGASANFQTQFKNARKNYWEKKKAEFEAKEVHTNAIDDANVDGAAFKASIKELANAIANQCTSFGRDAARQIIVDFNTANNKRADVYRILDFVKCHVGNLGVSGNPTCTQKPAADFKKAGFFEDIAVPDVTCPDEATLKAKIKSKQPNLNFHFKGSAALKGINADGNFVANQGWTPDPAACAKVNSHAETLFGKAYQYVWAHTEQSCTQACEKYGDQLCDLAKLREMNAGMDNAQGRAKFQEAMKHTQFSATSSIYCSAWNKKHSVNQHGGDSTWHSHQKHNTRHMFPQAQTPETPGGKECVYTTGPQLKPTCEAACPCDLVYPTLKGGIYHLCTKTRKSYGSHTRFCACKPK